MVERRAFLMSTGLSILAMYLVHQYISTQEADLEAKYGAPYQRMVVAKKDILQYETIRPTDIEEITVPAAMVPPGRIETMQEVIDAVASVPITKGEHILSNKIISRNVYSGLDTNIALGRRALSLRVNVKSSIGFMVRPGNRVDLAAHFKFKNANVNVSEVKVFMQDLLILAAGKTIQTNSPTGVDQELLSRVADEKQTTISPNNAAVRDTLEFVKTEQNFQTITLEVTPEQAQKIVYVATVYPDSLTLLLRHADDRAVDSKGTTNFLGIMGEDSWYVRSKRVNLPPRSIPKIRFYDYRGTNAVPVYSEDR